MRLNQLLAGVALTERRAGDVECSGICYDTRTMEPGCLFVALPGYKTDGHKYIAQALEQGAAAVLWVWAALPLLARGWPVPVYLLADTAAAAGMLALVAALTAAGLLQGTSGTTLSPKDTTTVEQGILLALRAYQAFAP